MVGKTRYREYSDAIKHTKERLEVDSDYSPYLIGRGLMTTPEDVRLLNEVNRILSPNRGEDRKQTSLDFKQMHFDYLLHSVERRKRKV